VAFCAHHAITLIDCQQHTRHLASFGAREIARSAFEAHVAVATTAQPPAAWAYDSAHWAVLGVQGPAAADDQGARRA